MITELEEKKKPANTQPPRKTTSSAPTHSAWDDEEPEVSGFKKWRIPVIIGALLAGGIGFVANSMSKKTAAPPPKMEPMKVEIVKHTPPPPQPTPPPPQQVEEKKVEMIEEVKPEEQAPPDPTPQVQTALEGKGDGGGMKLAKGDGSGVFANRNTVSAERMRWSAFAGQVKSRIGQVLESHPKTRKARMQLVVHVWLDDTGRITRAKLDGSTGDSALDAAIRDEILPGLQISGAPPQGMPMPINMRITARRPS